MAHQYIHAASVIEIDPARGGEDFAELKKALPGRQARRMSPLGILITSVLATVPVQREAVVIYATTFTESLALESYLDSLPHASPTHFQTSIHPGGIEQALILNQQPVAALYPLAGDRHIVSQALQLACTDERSEVIIVGGEEAGTWLTEMGVALDRSFAFALRLGQEPMGALGKISFQPGEYAESSTPALLEFARSVQTQTDVEWTSPGGAIACKWNRA